MFINDVYPLKAQFMKGEKITIRMELENPLKEDISAGLIVKVSHIDEIEEVIELSAREIKAGESIVIDVELEPRDEDFKGYGVDVGLIRDGVQIEELSTSFDVVSDWRKTPRYGFLADFYREDIDDKKDVESLRKLHINMVQFYDWMYRGDMLVSPSEEYIDMMGRKVNSRVVKQKISYCHELGMHPVAYGAVYSASREFYEKHRDWALYDGNSEVLKFIDRFYIMNISPDCPWHAHIIKQYEKAIDIMGFDGIHMDTYGFPKKAISIRGEEKKTEYLDEHFPILIENTRKTLSARKQDVCLIFNNVGNWPVDSIADTSVDAIYIAV